MEAPLSFYSICCEMVLNSRLLCGSLLFTGIKGSRSHPSTNYSQIVKFTPVLDDS